MRVRVTTGMPSFTEADSHAARQRRFGTVFTIASVEFEGASEIPEDRLREALALDADMPYTLMRSRPRGVGWWRRFVARDSLRPR